MRRAHESRSPQAAARALTSRPQLRHKWHKQVLTPLAAARGVELAPATAAALRPLRALARRQGQELPILKEARASCRL